MGQLPVMEGGEGNEYNTKKLHRPYQCEVIIKNHKSKTVLGNKLNYKKL